MWCAVVLIFKTKSQFNGCIELLNGFSFAIQVVTQTISFRVTHGNWSSANESNALDIPNDCKLIGNDIILVPFHWFNWNPHSLSLSILYSIKLHCSSISIEFAFFHENAISNLSLSSSLYIVIVLFNFHRFDLINKNKISGKRCDFHGTFSSVCYNQV